MSYSLHARVALGTVVVLRSVAIRSPAADSLAAMSDRDHVWQVSSLRIALTSALKKLCWELTIPETELVVPMTSHESFESRAKSRRRPSAYEVGHSVNYRTRTSARRKGSVACSR